MAHGLPRSMARASAQTAAVKKMIVGIDDLVISVAGTTGVGWGTAVLADLPEGNILFLGAVSYLTFTGPTDAALADTWEGDYGIGTTPADDGTITAADVDVIVSTALAAATAEASPRTRGTGLLADTGEMHDNTDGSLELNLNLLIDDADISGDMDITANGELHIAYISLGDD